MAGGRRVPHRRPEGSGALTGTLGKAADDRKVMKDVNKYVPPSRSLRGGRINLKAVAEVLAERGMDPTEAIVDVLHPVDEEGNPVPCKLPLDVQARINLELLQYVQPKLKSIEVRAKVAATSFDINDEQAKRIAEEFLKSGELE